jgi:hypothetical protein
VDSVVRVLPSDQPIEVCTSRNYKGPGPLKSGVLQDNRRRSEVKWIRHLASERRESAAGFFFAAISLYLSER